MFAGSKRKSETDSSLLRMLCCLQIGRLFGDFKNYKIYGTISNTTPYEMVGLCEYVTFWARLFKASLLNELV